MAEDHELTEKLIELQQGDPAAAAALWEEFYERMSRVADKRLKDLPQRAFDHEDVALSAFNSFCVGAMKGQFPDLQDRDELWKLLATITARKVAAQYKIQLAEKRGGGKIRGESVLAAKNGSDIRPGLQEIQGDDLSPDFASVVSETVALLLTRLGDPQLKAVAAKKLEGYSNEEIAASLHCTTRTVERKLQRIRELWQSSKKNPDTPSD